MAGNANVHTKFLSKPDSIYFVVTVNVNCIITFAGKLPGNKPMPEKERS